MIIIQLTGIKGLVFGLKTNSLALGLSFDVCTTVLSGNWVMLSSGVFSVWSFFKFSTFFSICTSWSLYKVCGGDTGDSVTSSGTCDTSCTDGEGGSECDIWVACCLVVSDTTDAGEATLGLFWGDGEDKLKSVLNRFSSELRLSSLTIKI